MIMAITMTLMKRASVQPGITPAGILRQVNKTLAEDNENVMFVTLFVRHSRPENRRIGLLQRGS